MFTSSLLRININTAVDKRIRVVICIHDPVFNWLCWNKELIPRLSVNKGIKMLLKSKH